MCIWKSHRIWAQLFPITFGGLSHFAPGTSRPYSAPPYVLIVKNKPVTTRSIRRYFPSGNAELLWCNRLVGVLWAPQRGNQLAYCGRGHAVAKTSHPSGTDFPHHEDPRSAPTYSQAASGPPSLYLPAPPHSDVIYLLHHVFTNLDQPASTVRVMFFSSAFNTIRLTLLAQRLKAMDGGCPSRALDYRLPDRKVIICVSSTLCGWQGYQQHRGAQGTLLSPFLFTLYITAQTPAIFRSFLMTLR